MDSHDIEKYFASHKSILGVLLVIVSIVSISGYFMGMRQGKDKGSASAQWLSTEKAVHDSGHYPVAPKYKDIPETVWKENHDWVNTLNNLPRQESDRSERPKMTDEEVKKVLATRFERRAYDGAPPMIPHAINLREVDSCVACHSQDSDVLIAGKRVPAMSHPYMASCTQCHAQEEGLKFAKNSGTVGLKVESSFEGNPHIGVGTRAYVGAPPTMPHRVWMRQNCMSCHGPDMPNAITTSHPQRANCLQCHAEDSNYDNREQGNPTLSK